MLSITEMHGGHVWNVVPDKASFQGTVRYFHKSDGELVEKRFKQQVQSIAAGYGITADIDWDDFQNPLVSDTELSKIVADNVRDYAQLEPIHPSMAGEDFCDIHARHHAGVRLHRIQRRGRLPGLAQPALRRS